MTINRLRTAAVIGLLGVAVTHPQLLATPRERVAQARRRAARPGELTRES